MKKGSSVISINSLDDLILNLIIKMNGKVIEVPTMYEKIGDTEIYFNIPLFEDNNDLFYPLNTGVEENEEDYDYCETGWLVINDFEGLLQLLKGYSVRINKFSGKYSKSSELIKLINEGKISIISQ